MFSNKIKRAALVILLFFTFLALTGCDESYQDYIKKDAALHKVKKVIVFPFKNISKDKNADDYLRNAINMELVKSGLFEMINLNEAEKALKEARIRTAGGVEDLSVSQIKKVGESLGIQGIIMGAIEDFGPGGKTGSPQFSGYIYLIDTNDANIVWSCSYTGSGDSKNYIFDINKIDTPTLHARYVIAKMFKPLIREAKTSEKKAQRKIAIEEANAASAKATAAALDDQTKNFDALARDMEDQASRKEKEAAELEDKALKMDPTAIGEKVKSLEGGLSSKGDELNKKEEDSKKIEIQLTENSQKVKELEEAEKQARSEAEEIAGQVNIYTAKQRVAVIRNNTEEAEKFKALAEEAKTKSEEATAKAENLKKEVTEAKARLDEITPKVNEARKKVNDLKGEIDKITANLSEVKKVQETSAIEPTEENIAAAKQAKQQADTAKAEAVVLREQASKSRADADSSKERAKKARQEAIDAEKRAAEIKAKLG